MPMIICTPCKREMICSRTGVTVTWNHSHRRPADEFRCQGCGSVVCVANDASYHSDSPVEADKHLEMNDDS